MVHNGTSANCSLCYRRATPRSRRWFPGIADDAADLLKVDPDAFLFHKDSRTQKDNIRNKEPSTPAFLRMPAASSRYYSKSNVLGECGKALLGSHDDENVVFRSFESSLRESSACMHAVARYLCRCIRRNCWTITLEH
jgi:hypothetical protein